MADSQASAAVVTGVLAVSFLVYAWLYERAVRTNGKVLAERFSYPDLGVCIFICSGILMLILDGFARLEKGGTRNTENIQALISGVAVYAVILSIIWGYLALRKIPPGEAFGMWKLAPGSILGLAVPLILAAMPMVLVVSNQMERLLGDQAKSQEIVEFFKKSASQSDKVAIWFTVAIAVLIAPFVEEFLFRGFIYGILKRFGGVSFGLFVNAALFAGLHLNLAALPSLFVLALCLTLAYELSGSILVPMCMHALFNSLSLLLLAYPPQGK